MQPLLLWLVVIRMQLQPDVRLCLAICLRDFSHKTMRDSSLVRSFVSQGWSREKFRSRKKPIETLRDPTLVFVGLFSNCTLTDRTLFWMASVRCDFQHQSVWSVFACGRKKDACGRKKQHRPNEKIVFFVRSVLSIFYVGIVL